METPPGNGESSGLVQWFLCHLGAQIALNTSPLCHVSVLGAITTKVGWIYQQPLSKEEIKALSCGQSPQSQISQPSLTAAPLRHHHPCSCILPLSALGREKRICWDSRGFLGARGLTCSHTILWYTSCLMLISTSNSESFLSASVLAARVALQGDTCWGKSSMFLRTGTGKKGTGMRDPQPPAHPQPGWQPHTAQGGVG